MSAIAILGELNHRYLIVGSTAIQLHGFHWGQHDIDAWLDPTIPVDEWDAMVKHVSRNHQKIWNRGDDNGRGGIQHSTRIASSPKLDLIHQIGQFEPGDFESVFDRSLISELGNVAPLDVVLRMKLQANRGKDFRHFMKLIQMITNP
jgi:hypothetical protein